jgi:hypothetical protein
MVQPIHAERLRVGDETKGDQSMRKIVPGLVVAAVVALSAPAGAVSVMNQAGFAAAVDQAAVVEQVADGCGRGWFRGPGGRCRPMRGGVVVAPGGPVVVAPPVVVVPRARWCHRPYSSRNFRC